MMTKCSLLRSARNLDPTVTNELLRYGKITADNRWREETGHYFGENRALEITHLGVVWFVEMLNGETISITSCPE